MRIWVLYYVHIFQNSPILQLYVLFGHLWIVQWCTLFAFPWVNVTVRLDTASPVALWGTSLFCGVSHAPVCLVCLPAWLHVQHCAYCLWYKMLLQLVPIWMIKKWINWCTYMSFDIKFWFLRCTQIIRINKDMQLILYSPGIWVIHSEGRYITDIRMQTTK